MTTVLVNEGRYSVSPEEDTLIPVHPSLCHLQAKLLKNQPVTIVGTWDFSSVEEIFISVRYSSNGNDYLLLYLDYLAKNGIHLGTLRINTKLVSKL